MSFILIPKESEENEARVAATPETVKMLVNDGFTVAVETGAGKKSHFLDVEYQDAGAIIARGSESEW